MTTTARSSAPAPRATLTRFPAARIRSLVWDADALVDWVDGGVRWTLQGQSSDPAVRYAFSFDMATTLPGSGYSVIYKRLGTKGLVLKDGRIVREIDRSYYHAEAYEFPVALFRLPSGRPAIVHCPEDYCRLRIDDLETGEVITTATDAAGDFFHSRLSVSSDGRWLASAGWMWHPVDDVAVYDLHVALTDGRALDSATRELDVLTDNGNAAGFDRRNRLVVTGDLFGSDWRGDDSEPAAPGGPCVVRIAPVRGTRPNASPSTPTARSWPSATTTCCCSAATHACCRSRAGRSWPSGLTSRQRCPPARSSQASTRGRRSPSTWRVRASRSRMTISSP